MDWIFHWNKELLNYLNSFAHNEFIEIIVKTFTDTPIFVLPLFLSLYWIYYSWYNIFHPFSQKSPDNPYKQKSKLLCIFYSVILGLCISLLIQQFVHIDRPEQHINAWWKLLLDHLPDASFPSDHATVSMAFLAALYFYWYQKWAYVLLIPFLLMNLSRVVAWVHWPLDIIAGTLVWIMSAFMMKKNIWQLKLVKKINSEIMKISNHLKL